MARDVTQLVMKRYFIDELSKSIIRDSNRLDEMWLELQRKCDHPKTHLIGANIAYDMDAKKCTICDKII